MASSINGCQGSALPQIIEALQKLHDDPERLAQERRRYDSPPPCSSGETTQPSSPAPPLSEADRRIQRLRDRDRSRPYDQFMYQWRREEDRIIEQIDRRRERRKATLPHIYKLDYTTNAGNNIQDNWIEQGIWKDEWTGCPFGRWKHEEPVEDEIEVQPEPDPLSIGTSGHLVRPPSPPPTISEEQRAVRRREAAAAAASRPLPQFLYQVAKEREWLDDELWHEKFPGPVDLDAMANENIKKCWTEQKIWNPKWAEEPGIAWIHEEPDEDGLEVPPAHEAVSADQTDVAKSPEQPPRPFPLPSNFGLPSPEPNDGDRVNNDVSSSSRRDDIRSTFNKQEISPSHSPVDLELAQAPAEPVVQTLRKVRSSRVQKRGQTKPRSTKSSVIKLSQDSSGVTEAPNDTAHIPTVPEVDMHNTEAFLVGSKPVRPRRGLDGGSDAGEPSPRLPRRSARIKTRIGTSKCTVYDRADSPAAGRGRGQLRSTRQD